MQCVQRAAAAAAAAPRRRPPRAWGSALLNHHPNGHLNGLPRMTTARLR
jgi:hypothetical protein